MRFDQYVGRVNDGCMIFLEERGAGHCIYAFTVVQPEEL